MSRELTDLTFEQWVAYVFDHPIEEQRRAWYFDLDAEWWDESSQPAVTVAYVRRLFENIAQLAAPYSDAQLNQGLWFLVSSTGSNHMFALLDQRVPLDERRRCIASFFDVFRDLFAPRCSPVLGHTQREYDDRNPLNSVCYMWWDVLPYHGKSGDPARDVLDRDFLKVMVKTLELESEACRESALHGLGHWARAYPEVVGQAIDDFLKRYGRAISPELKAYALAARGGCVL